MKIHCPECSAVVAAENISLPTGWAKCGRCNEVFKLADAAPDYVPAGPQAATPVVERPFDAWAVVERSDQRLMIHIPAQGMRSGTWGMMFFALFWTGFVAFWTAGALGVFFNNGQIQWANAIFACFSIPFWLVGFGMLGGVLWIARGTRTVYLDASQLVTEMRCLLWRRRRARSRDQVQHAREAVVQVQSNQPQNSPCGVEIIFVKGSFRLPCNSEAEQAWLLFEINDFLQQTPYWPKLEADFGSLLDDPFRPGGS